MPEPLVIGQDWVDEPVQDAVLVLVLEFVFEVLVVLVPLLPPPPPPLVLVVVVG